jgi:hypothetical protein
MEKNFKTSGTAVFGATATAQLASPEAHFEACLERSARGLCKARGIDPEASAPYDSGTMAYTLRPAWRNAAEELRAFWLLHMFAHTLP